jgi:hypothetical protein
MEDCDAFDAIDDCIGNDDYDCACQEVISMGSDNVCFDDCDDELLFDFDDCDDELLFDFEEAITFCGDCMGSDTVDCCELFDGCDDDGDDGGMTGSNVLSISDGFVDAGGVTTIEVSLENPYDTIAGFEFYLTDFPNSYGSFVGFGGTERTSGFQISAQEQANGTYIIVGFDLSLTGILGEEGPILTIDYRSDGVYTAEIDIDITDQSILSDSEVKSTATPTGSDRID